MCRIFHRVDPKLETGHDEVVSSMKVVYRDGGFLGVFSRSVFLLLLLFRSWFGLFLNLIKKSCYTEVTHRVTESQ